MNESTNPPRRYMSPEEYQQRSLELTQLYQIWQQHLTFMKVLEYDKKSFMYNPSIHKQIEYILDDIKISTPTEPTDISTAEQLLKTILEAKKQLEKYSSEENNDPINLEEYLKTSAGKPINVDAFDDTTTNCLNLVNNNISNWSDRIYFIPIPKSSDE